MRMWNVRPLQWMFLLCIVCVLSGMVSCSKKKPDSIEITLIHGWGSSENDHIAMRQIYQDFEKDNPDIRLNLLSMPSSDDVVDMTEDMLSVGKLPDIIFTGGGGTDSIYRFMVEKQYAVDLMPYIQEDLEFKANISDTVLNYWMTKDQKLYTISDVLLLVGYWYNEDIFREAGIEKLPATWNEFHKVCEQIANWAENHQKDLVPLLLDSDHLLYLTDALLAGYSDTALHMNHLGEMEVDDASFIKSMQCMKDIYEYSALVDTSSDSYRYTYRDTLQSFNLEKTAIYINGVWANTMIDSKHNVRYAAFPSVNGESISCMSACTGYILGNTNEEERIEASVRFLKYMLSSEIQERILTETGQIPSNPLVDIWSYAKENERLYQSVEVVKDADLQIEIPANLWKNSRKEKYIETVIQYLKDSIDLDTFLKIYQKEK